MHWVRRVRLAFVLLVVGAAGVATAFAATTAPGSSSARAAVATTVAVRGTDTAVSVSPKTFAKGTVMKDPEFSGGSEARLCPGGRRCSGHGSPEEVLRGVA